MGSWKSYEEVATFLLNQFAREFGLKRVEGKQTIPGCLTDWAIDAKGILEGDEGFVVIECRRYTTSRPSQEQLGALAYRIKDMGASAGIIVTPLGIQEGAQKIAAKENIVDVRLNADSTTEEYVLSFLKRVMVGLKDTALLGDKPDIEVHRKCRTCGEMFELIGNETECPSCRCVKGDKG
jgi:Zn finger protein HypA/HybF involved in hydrogenase expression